MNEFWDLTVEQKAELTDEEIERYVAIERMESGVAPPMEPKYEEVGEDPDLRERTYWQIEAQGKYGRSVIMSDIYFQNEEDAHDFMNCEILVSQGYNEGVEYISQLNPGLVSASRFHQDDYLKNKQLLDASKGAKERNHKKRETYKAALEKYLACGTDIYEAIREARVRAERLQYIRDTFANYVDLAGGDEDVAFNFLKKAFDDEDIDDALEL